MWESAGSYSSWVASWPTKEAKLEEEGEGGPEYQGNPGVFTSQAQVTAHSHSWPETPGFNIGCWGREEPAESPALSG